MPVVTRTQVLETHAHMMITWHPWCTTSGVTASKDRQGRESTRAELELDHNTPTMACSRSGRVREDNRIKNNVAGDLPRVCVLTLMQIGMLSESNMRLSTIIQTSVFAMWTIYLTIRSSASTPAVGGSIVRPDSGEERHVQVESVYKSGKLREGLGDGRGAP
jgi:hypothetical protein